MKLANINTIKDRAVVKVPSDYNKYTKEHLELEWKRFSVDETKDMLENISNGTATEDDIIADALIDISNLKDEAGKELSYSIDLLNQVMNINYIRKAIVQSFMAVQLGREVLKQKN